MFSRRVAHFTRGATSILCVLLTLNLCVLTPGCGWSFNNGMTTDPVVHIPLTADHPVAKALAGTGFAGATMLEVNRATGEFKFVFPDTDRSLSGQLEWQGSSWEMSSFNFQNGGLSAQMQMDTKTGQVKSIETAAGDTWHPSKTAVASSRVIGQDRLSDYLAVNDELINLNSDKTDSSFIFIPLITSYVMMLWLLCADSVVYCPGFLPIFLIIIAILGSTPPPVPAGNPVVLPPVNQPPVAKNDAFSTPRNTAVTGNVLSDNGSGADSDPDNDTLTTTMGTAPTNGTAALQTSGALTYTPNTDFTGIDTFTYQLSDGNGGTSSATVTITVVAVNRPPVARNDAFTVFGETNAVGNVLNDNGSGADSDPDGDTLTVTAVNGVAANVGTLFTLPSGVGLLLNADGSFTYFNTGFARVDTFTYTISDGNGGTSTATVTITVRFPD